MKKIIAVVVTFNRGKLLLRCLSSIFQQTEHVDSIIIIDNASTDGTENLLSGQNIISGTDNINFAANSKISHEINETSITYVRLAKNVGGAGGFEYGVRLARRLQADFVWLMDDDGYPEAECLEKLLEYSDRYHYILPISLDTTDNNELTWYIKNKKGRRIKKYSALKEHFPEDIMPSAVPFNGLLLSRKIIDTVGFPKGEMFIWGDDFEHQYRCLKQGFEIVTLLDAKFYHPADKAEHFRIFFGLIPINYSESKLHFTCLIRNSTFNYWNYLGKHRIIIKYLMYTWFFIVSRKMDIFGYKHYLRCVWDGIKGRFDRHKKYI